MCCARCEPLPFASRALSSYQGAPTTTLSSARQLRPRPKTRTEGDRCGPCDSRQQRDGALNPRIPMTCRSPACNPSVTVGKDRFAAPTLASTLASPLDHGTKTQSRVHSEGAGRTLLTEQGTVQLSARGHALPLAGRPVVGPKVVENKGSERPQATTTSRGALRLLVLALQEDRVLQPLGMRTRQAKHAPTSICANTARVCQLHGCANCGSATPNTTCSGRLRGSTQRG